MLKGKITSMRENCETAELESKASRETIMRLVTEAEREQKSVNRHAMDMEALRLVSHGCIWGMLGVQSRFSVIRSKSFVKIPQIR